MKQKTITKSLLLLGIALTGLFVSLNHSSSVFAYSLTVSTSGSVTANVMPSADGGIGTTVVTDNVNIISDCRAGYTMTIAGPNDNNLYLNGDSTNNTSGTYFSPVNGTSALNNSANANKWGYSLTANSGTGVFSALSSTPTTLKTPSQTASPDSDIDTTIPVYYGTAVNTSMAPGSYTFSNNNHITYYVIMDGSCNAYTINFDSNGGTGSVTNQNVPIGVTTKLSSAETLIAPTSDSYIDADSNTITGDPDKLWIFWGWNTSVDGTGNWYKDREEISNLTATGNTITLYAQWKQATLADLVPGTPISTEKVIDYNKMQDMRPEICWNSTAYSADASSPAHTPYNPSTNTGGYHTITLLDYRGKIIGDASPEPAEQYTVSKLPDGLCWMTKDLNLGRSGNDGPNGNGTVTLTSEDTDITANFILPASPTVYSTNSLTAQILTNHTVDSYTVNNASYTPVTSYYSWAAATTINANIDYGANITSSICPRNWDLPTSAHYPNLRTKGLITSAAIAHAEPYNFIYGGYRNGTNDYYNQTSYGYYWTSTNYYSNYGYWSYTYNSGLYASTSSAYKYYGAKLRCVASQGTATIYYDGNGTIEYPTTGSVATQSNIELNSAKAQPNSFTRNGWGFKSWNTKPDGSGTTIYANGSLALLNLKPSDTLTLYAQWGPQFTITYVNNCLTYASTETTCTQSVSDRTSEQRIDLDDNGDGSSTLASYNKWTLTGWKIKGWSVVTDNSTNTNAEYPYSSTYTVSNQVAGDNIILYAHWVPIYTVQYDGNGASNSATGMGSVDSTTNTKTVRHDNVAEGDRFDLFASNFRRDGYGFVGWSIDANAWSKLIDNNNTNDVRIWGPNETFTAPAFSSSVISLYAIWAPAETSGGNPMYLQNWTGCPNLSATLYDPTSGKLTVHKNSITALTDNRDNQVYAVAKLADGNCWMIENLRISNAHQENSNTISTTLTNTNTNIVDNNSPLPITNIYSPTTKSNSLSPSSTQNINNDPDYGWCNSSSASCSNQSRLRDDNTTTNITPSLTQNITSFNAHVNFDQTIYTYSNYYNWYSATAGYGTVNKSSGNTEGDLCPKGWKLPYGGSSSTTGGGNTKSGFYYLANQLDSTTSNQVNSNKLRSFPNNLVYSGYINNSSLSSRGSAGLYWTSTTSSSSQANYLSIGSTTVSPNSNTYKYNGLSIRCTTYTHILTLDSNNGSNKTSPLFGMPEQTIDLPSAPFDYAGMIISSWNTEPDGSGVNYTTTFDMPANPTSITLYAQWTAGIVIHFNSNSGSGTMSPQTITENTSVTLHENTFTAPQNTYFIGWMTEESRVNNEVVYTDQDAYVSPSITPSNNNITLYAKWGPNYTIIYNGNNATGGSMISDGVELKHTSNNLREGTSVNLYAPNYYKTNFGFAGWSPSSTATIGGDDPIYGPNATISAPAYDKYGVEIDGVKTIILYPVWVPSAGNLQGWNGCSNLSIGDVTALTDTRDNNVYSVARLADGNCWMIENLRLNSEYSSDETKAQGFGGVFVGLDLSENSNFSNTTVATPTGLYNETNIGNGEKDGYRFPRYNNHNTNLSLTPRHTGGFNYSWYSYGNYYSWAAAKANTTRFVSYDGDTASDASGTSICPTNWELPHGKSGNGGYYYLFQHVAPNIQQYSVTASKLFRAFPNNFVYSGSTHGSRGVNAYYWTRSINFNYDHGAYYANLYNSSFYPNSVGGDKSNGYTIRCIISP